MRIADSCHRLCAARVIAVVTELFVSTCLAASHPEHGSPTSPLSYTKARAPTWIRRFHANPAYGATIRSMSTFAHSLKSEIARVARKELKEELQTLRKASSAQRTDIAALKRDLKQLQGLLKQVQRASAKAMPAPKTTEAQASAPRAGRSERFDAAKLAAHRAALGFTQAQMAALIGASALSVYKWESGKVQPRAAQAQQIAAALKLGKRAAVARVAEAASA